MIKGVKTELVKSLKMIFYLNFIKQNTFHIKHTAKASVSETHTQTQREKLCTVNNPSNCRYQSNLYKYYNISTIWQKPLAFLFSDAVLRENPSDETQTRGKEECVNGYCLFTVNKSNKNTKIKMILSLLYLIYLCQSSTVVRKYQKQLVNKFILIQSHKNHPVF